jgi:hypothetical protein
MKLQKLWYVRKGGSVRGPFPEKLVKNDLMLGRLAATDEVSLDRINWVPITDYPELVPEPPQPVPQGEEPNWQEERRRAAYRWVDERRLIERRSGTARPVEAEQRHRRDRRQHAESAETLLLRQRHTELEEERRQRRERFLGVGLVLILLLALAAWAVMRLTPVNPVPVGLGQTAPACARPAAPQVNWAGCDKGGTWLRGVDLSSAVLTAARFNSTNLSLSNLSYANLVRADLSYANLSGASLLGATLQQADLSYADLSDTDLRLADLRGAKLGAAILTGARLDQAIWIDGRECAKGSVGACR